MFCQRFYLPDFGTDVLIFGERNIVEFLWRNLHRYRYFLKLHHVPYFCIRFQGVA